MSLRVQILYRKHWINIGDINFQYYEQNAIIRSKNFVGRNNVLILIDACESHSNPTLNLSLNFGQNHLLAINVLRIII